MATNEKKNGNKYDYLQSYARYFSLVTQMIVLLVLGGFGGRALDNYLHSGKPLFTVILIVLAAILSFYLFFKSIFTKP